MAANPCLFSHPKWLLFVVFSHFPNGPQSLDTFNTSLVTPIYYVMFTTCTILSSAILFEAWDSSATTKSGQSQNMDCQAVDSGSAPFVTSLCGFLVISAGVMLLHSSKQEDALIDEDEPLPAHTAVGLNLVKPGTTLRADLTDDRASPFSDFEQL
eukprot:m.186599 g.186599  ORF g.186599 m.186599 type:complete len:155 (+) comp14757_c0_seq8:321-785(+)